MRPKPIAVAILLVASAILRADSKPKPQESERPISTITRLNLIRGLNAEFVFVRSATRFTSACRATRHWRLLISRAGKPAKFL